MTNKHFTTTRRLILLNVVLLFVATGLSELILRGLFGEPYTGAFFGGFISSIILRIIFGSGNPREFKKKQKTITASNGEVFSKKHEYIVNAVIFGSIGLGWLWAFNFGKTLPPVLPQLIVFAFFQLSVKGTLFILDLPIGTFNVDQRKVIIWQISSGSRRNSFGVTSINNDIYTSPAFKNLPCNTWYHHRH